MARASTGSVAIDTVPLPERQALTRQVRVTVPARVAFDLGKMHHLTAAVLDRFGCPECHSGLDIRFDIATRFWADENLNLREEVGGGIVING